MCCSVKDKMMRRYTPFDEFDSFFDRMGRGFELMGTQTSQVAVDIADDDEAFTLTADLPGFDREDIDLTIADSVVTIAAEHSYDQDGTGDDGAYLHRERRTTSLQRRVQLPEAVDEEAVSAAYHNGVLSVTLPKQSTVAIEEGRRIDIE